MTQRGQIRGPSLSGVGGSFVLGLVLPPSPAFLIILLLLSPSSSTAFIRSLTPPHRVVVAGAGRSEVVSVTPATPTAPTERRGWAGPPSTSAIHLRPEGGGGNGNGDESDETRQDLFDYFDPLLSPHSYPNGIGPDRGPRPSRSPGDGEILSRNTEGSNSFSASAEVVEAEVDSGAEGRDERRGGAFSSPDAEGGGEPDLLDYFDPLLSPHSYPNGIDAAVDKSPEFPKKEEDGDDWTPFRLSGVKNDFSKESAAQTPRRGWEKRKRPLPSSSSPRPSSAAGPPSDLLDVFDPRLSPHSYPRGIPHSATGADGVTYSAFSSSAPVGDTEGEVEVIGVLLIDHGSKKGASNARLRKLARLYQERTLAAADGESKRGRRIVVKQAHMEIAQPSIEDGLRALVEEVRADQIVCHPYFLSPGRHATKDIPRIIGEVSERLGITVPISITETVGSDTDAMLRVIDNLVRKALGEAEDEGEEVEEDLELVNKYEGGETVSVGTKRIGGLFGDIQRMMEEE